MKRFLVLAFTLLLGVSVSLGQNVSVSGGSIEGDITDPSGAKVAGATVTISNTETGYSKTLTTDKAGFYSLGPVIPGAYKVHIVSAGFQTLDVNTVIRVGTATAGTFKLTLGKSSETIEVTAGAVQVNTDQAGVSDVLTFEQIQSIPVNGRNFLDIAQIEPGVILQPGSTFDPTKAGYSAISVGGVSGRTTRILLDGQDITDETVGTTIMNVSQGAIGEFQLNRSTQDASGEVTSTGQVLVSTNSGTNHLHGLAFYNFQDARALFADANVIAIKQTDGTPVANPYFQRNQFGGSVGGPIVKDKLFFFANVERIKQTSQTPANLGAAFGTINAQFPNISTPYKLTYSTGRLDYTGPFGGHYFARVAYDVDAADRNPSYYELYTNRDNTYGFAGGADFQNGRFTHAFRGSYEKFHNFIADHVAGNASLYDPLPGFTLSYGSNIAFGPNANVPQATYQSDKQFRYDGSWTIRQHIVRYGYSINRILGGGFFAAGALSPSATISASTQLNGVATAANPNAFGCNDVVNGTPCLGDPLNGYDYSALTVSNGLGGENEIPAFGLQNGGQFDWREGAYIQDSWKVTPALALSAGLRWSVDTGRANQDLAPALCSDIDPTKVTVPAGCATPTTTIFGLFNPSYTGKVHQSYGNFAPQIGLAYAPGNHKTVFRAGTGMFFESDVFNNASNARNNLLKPAYGYARISTICSAYSINLPDGTVQGNVAPGATSTTNPTIQTACHESVGAAAPYFLALQKQYINNQAANPATNGAFIGNTLTIAGQYAPNYRTPYSVQYNFGVQREIRPGTIISADYLHNSTIHIGQTLDQNHVGAARTFNLTNAQQAIAATLAVTCKLATGYTVPTSVQAAITPGGCSGGSGSATGGKYATIKDFASNGLDRGQTYNAGNPASYSKKNNQNNVLQAQSAFPGLNGALGTGSFIAPIGRSGYDALQLVFKQQVAHPIRGVKSSNFQASYSLSRIVATTSSSDEFFSPAVIDNDNPTSFIGRSALDHKHQISFGGSATLKYGPRISLLAHFQSASPSNLTLDTQLTNGGIFQTDVTGDGTVGDIAPGTKPGAYMHDIKKNTLFNYINTYNSTVAGTLTPAGKAVAASGLISAAQLVQMGAAVQPLTQIASGSTQAIGNPAFRQMDLNFSYPIPLSRLRMREGIVLEPAIAFYNVGNFSNFSNDSAVLQNTTTAACTSYAQTSTYVIQPFYGNGGTGNYNSCASGSGDITGINTLATSASKRTVRNIGTFAQGAQRTTEFQLKLTF
jgi:hypothetical protein